MSGEGVRSSGATVAVLSVALEILAARISECFAGDRGTIFAEL